MILDCYALLAQGRGFRTGGIYTDERMLADVRHGIEGEMIRIGGIWVDDDADVIAQIERVWGAEGLERYRRSGAFVKPTRIQNLLYCNRLRSLFGDRVAATPGFDREGIYELPQGQGVMIPERDGKRISGFRFMRFSELWKKRG